jgi:excinuclease ABC subunit C
MLDQKRQLIKAKIKEFPTSSGCYLMLNELSEIIYVGKAKNLQNRLLSYFKSNHESLKTQALVEQVDDVEFILTSNEVESLVLENNLIKEHRPKYNIRLRDDKSYPYIQWNHQELYPRLEYTRRLKKSKNYSQLGPFPEGFSFGRSLYKLIKLLKLRDCTSNEFAKRKTPCLLYQMDQCMAPCVRLCSAEEYQNHFNLIIDFLKKPSPKSLLLSYISQQTELYAQSEQFEKAMQWRDIGRDLEHYVENFESQKVENLSLDENSDFIGLSLLEHECDISIYKVRQGRLIGTGHFYWLNLDDKNHDQQEFQTQLLDYYRQSMDLPQKIITPWAKETNEIFLKALNKINPKTSKVQVFTSSKNFAPLLEQAKLLAGEKARLRLLEQKQTLPALEELKDLLCLKTIPRVIECYDIAIWSGSSPTASQVVFVDGRAAKADYRYYHLEQRLEGNNDFAMMKEVMTRRLKKGKLPDLILIDGGKGQFSSVDKILKEFNQSISLVALAKEKNGKKERVFLAATGEAIELDDSKASTKILVQIRDEAHRFSRKLHHHAEKKRLLGI